MKFRFSFFSLLILFFAIFFGSCSETKFPEFLEETDYGDFTVEIVNMTENSISVKPQLYNKTTDEYLLSSADEYKIASESSIFLNYNSETLATLYNSLIVKENKICFTIDYIGNKSYGGDLPLINEVSGKICKIIIKENKYDCRISCLRYIKESDSKINFSNYFKINNGTEQNCYIYFRVTGPYLGSSFDPGNTAGLVLKPGETKELFYNEMFEGRYPFFNLCAFNSDKTFANENFGYGKDSTEITITENEIISN